MRTLIYYPNCSKGGVTSVIRGRAANNPDAQYDAIFSNERGGGPSFKGLRNVNVRVVRPDRMKTYLEYLTSRFEYDDIRVLSSPEIANNLASHDQNVVTYEFHSSDWDIVKGEIGKLDIDRMSKIVVPSETSRRAVAGLLPKRLVGRLVVESNLIDVNSFKPEGSDDFLDGVANGCSMVPLVWVGRFDQGKGCDYLPRIIAQLPSECHAYVVVSLENDPQRVGRFLYECDAAGVRDRVHVYMNLFPAELGNLYRSAANKGGWFVSTSLMESFGYAVREAIECGLRVASFNLPAFEGLSSHHLYNGTPIGDVSAIAHMIKRE